MKSGLVLLGVLCATTVAASAGTLHYSLWYETTFADEASARTTGAGIGDKSDILFGRAPGNDPNWVHRIAVGFSMSGMGYGEDLAGLGFSLTVSGGVTVSSPYPWKWVPYNPVVVVPSTFAPSVWKTTGTLYSANHDVGADWNDLDAILIETSPDVMWGLENANLNVDSSFDGQPLTAPAGPEYTVQKLGYIFVKWDGTFGGIDLEGAPEQLESHNWSIFPDNANGLSGQVVPVSSKYTFGTSLLIPEPATLSLLLVAGLAVMRRRNRSTP